MWLRGSDSWSKSWGSELGSPEPFWMLDTHGSLPVTPASEGEDRERILGGSWLGRLCQRTLGLTERSCLKKNMVGQWWRKIPMVSSELPTHVCEHTRMNTHSHTQKKTQYKLIFLYQRDSPISYQYACMSSVASRWMAAHTKAEMQIHREIGAAVKHQWFPRWVARHRQLSVSALRYISWFHLQWMCRLLLESCRKEEKEASTSRKPQ